MPPQNQFEGYFTSSRTTGKAKPNEPIIHTQLGVVYYRVQHILNLSYMVITEVPHVLLIWTHMVAAELYGCCVDGIYQHGGVQNMDYGLILRKRSLWLTDVHGVAGSVGVMMVMTTNDGNDTQ